MRVWSFRPHTTVACTHYWNAIKWLCNIIDGLERIFRERLFSKSSHSSMCTTNRQPAVLLGIFSVGLKSGGLKRRMKCRVKTHVSVPVHDATWMAVECSSRPLQIYTPLAIELHLWAIMASPHLVRTAPRSRIVGPYWGHVLIVGQRSLCQVTAVAYVEYLDWLITRPC